MHQQALNRARPIKNFYDCPSSEAYSSLTFAGMKSCRIRAITINLQQNLKRTTILE